MAAMSHLEEPYHEAVKRAHITYSNYFLKSLESKAQ